MRLCYESYTNNDIECILRDLSISENLDIRELINSHKSIKKQTKHSKKSKKIQDIISSNKQRQQVDKINSDLERLRYFKHLKVINSKIINELSNFITEEGKTKMKLKLLKLAFKNNNQKFIIDLYLQVISSNMELTKKETKLINKATKYMETINYKELQFKKLSNQLKPLDFYNSYKLKLDQWQIDVINDIDKGNSVLVSAPTSCGKTWLSLYPGLISKKILFIVPTEALVFQVGSMFSKFVKQPTLISDNILYITNNNIIIGTPKAIEDKLPGLDIDFDIIIIDEVHNLGCLDIHHYYERLLKIFSNKQLLALSATIGNPHKLLNWLKKIGYKNINLISYETRFLNLQRQIFSNNKLVKLHPISCLDLKDFNKGFLKNNIPMTPHDCIVLYEGLVKEFPKEMKNLKLSKIFPENNCRLSLSDSRHYEKLLKDKLCELKIDHSDKLASILDNYKLQIENSSEPNLYNLFKEIKQNNLTPCIVFQENTYYCKEIFIKLVGYLEKLESLNYPFYYENLEFRQEQYLKSVNDIAKFKKTIKLGKEVVNKDIVLDDKIKSRQDELNKDFLKIYTVRLTKQIQKIERNTITDKIKHVQKTNLQKEIDSLIDNHKLRYVDIFKKHKDFSLNTDCPMTAEKIREIKKTISKKLQIDVSYTNVFMQGLKRGIGIYTKHMPSIYNMVVQKLAQNGELGYVIADEQLALGINMPFRSSCILGYKDSTNFKISNYLQMIGRAGRRGKDREGHIIFVNVDWKNLMKSELGEIKSKYIHYPTYNVINTFTDKYNSVLPKINKNKMIEYESDEVIINDFFDEETMNIIVWKLRRYKLKSLEFCKDLDDIRASIKFTKTIKDTYNVITFLSKYFFTDVVKNLLIDIIKKNKIENGIKEIYSFLDVIIDIHTSLLNDEIKYNKIIKLLEYTFYYIKKLLNKCNNLN
tara:strand:+ start:1017 stop:3806 length:2790 start_codon:yes stop_codon:yes gene_type:complete